MTYSAWGNCPVCDKPLYVAGGECNCHSIPVNDALPDRPIFGVHRLPASQRTSAAWPTLAQIEGRSNARFARWVKTAPVGLANPAIRLNGGNA